MTWDFLRSSRFWKLFMVAVVQFLAGQEIISAEFANAVTIWFGGSVVIRTLDRTVDKATTEKTS